MHKYEVCDIIYIEPVRLLFNPKLLSLLFRLSMISSLTSSWTKWSQFYLFIYRLFASLFLPGAGNLCPTLILPSQIIFGKWHHCFLLSFIYWVGLAISQLSLELPDWFSMVNESSCISIISENVIVREKSCKVLKFTDWICCFFYGPVLIMLLICDDANKILSSLIW